MIGKTFIRNDRVVNSSLFKEKCPTAYKNLGRAIRLYKVMLKIGSGACYLDGPDKENQFGATFTDMLRLYNKTYHTNTSPKTISHYLVALLKHGMIVKVKDTDVNDDLYGAMIGYLKKKQEKKYYHASVFHVPILYDKKMKEIEEAALDWKEKGYTLSGAAFDSILQAEGYDLCEELYPQYSKKKKDVARTISDAFDSSYKRVERYVKEKIEEKGYCIERDVKEDLCIRRSTTFKKYIPSLLGSLHLKEVRTNKKLIELFGLDDISGYPLLLVPEELSCDEEKEK